MTDKEFRRLKRADLIEIIYELQKQEQQLRTELASVREQLDSKELKIANAGSIAEAVVGLHDIFQTAQETADQYLAQVRAANADTEARCAQLLEDARRQADELLQQADREIAEKWSAFRQASEQTADTETDLPSDPSHS